jgi:catechol 2,3-dioxygenase-like lactoylglutathione lyase family enzyme
MEVKGIVWHGTRTERFEEMAQFVENVLGMRLDQRQETNIVFSAPNGDAFEVFPASEEEHTFYSHPAIGFLVDDVEAARAEMEAKGVEFIGPIHYGTPGETWGSAWSHFRAPDGFVYALVSRPEAYPGGKKRNFRELRVCFAVDDLDAVRRLYGEGLGLPIVDDWQHPTGERGILFAVCPASLEFFDRAQAAFADQHEVGRPISGPVTLRIEVESSIEETMPLLLEAGWVQVADARRTPWNQRVLRMQAPDGLQLTLFEMDPTEEAERWRARSLLPN